MKPERVDGLVAFAVTFVCGCALAGVLASFLLRH
jgi:hypothetical protein